MTQKRILNLGQVDYELNFPKSVRQLYAHSRVLSNKINKIEIR